MQDIGYDNTGATTDDASLLINGSSLYEVDPLNLITLHYKNPDSSSSLEYLNSVIYGEYNIPIMEGDYIGNGDANRILPIFLPTKNSPRLLLIGEVHDYYDNQEYKEGFGKIVLLFNFGNAIFASSGINGIGFNLLQNGTLFLPQFTYKQDGLHVSGTEYGFNVTANKYCYYGIGWRSPSPQYTG